MEVFTLAGWQGLGKAPGGVLKDEQSLRRNQSEYCGQVLRAHYH